MATKPLDKMSKPELVKALKAAQKRIAKLERTEDMRAITDSQVAQSEEPEDQAPAAFPWNDKPEEK